MNDAAQRAGRRGERRPHVRGGPRDELVEALRRDVERHAQRRGVEPRDLDAERAQVFDVQLRGGFAGRAGAQRGAFQRQDVGDVHGA